MKITVSYMLNSQNAQNQNIFVNTHSEIKSHNQVVEGYAQEKHFERSPGYLSFKGNIIKIHTDNPNSLGILIKELINYKGDNLDFAKFAFNKLKTHLGYKNLIKDNFKLVDIPDEGTGSRFNYRTGEFQMDKSTCLMLSRAEIASVLRHEFEHFLQAARMFRSEEIGIENFLKQECLCVLKDIESEAYILGEKLSPDSKASILSPSHDNIDMDFWNKIIDSKGTLKKNSAEAREAMEDFENLANHKSYINANDLKKYSNFPELQETVYYDKHGIGFADKYSRKIMEIKASKVEKDFLNTYIKLSGEPFIPNEKVVSAREYSNAIEDFMNVIHSKYKTNELPDRFKAYLYDEAAQCFLNTIKDCDITDCIKGACKEVTSWSDYKARIKLYTFKNLMNENLIRLNSKKETDDFMKFVEDY